MKGHENARTSQEAQLALKRGRVKLEGGGRDRNVLGKSGSNAGWRDVKRIHCYTASNSEIK